MSKFKINDVAPYYFLGINPVAARRKFFRYTKEGKIKPDKLRLAKIHFLEARIKEDKEDLGKLKKEKP